MKSSIPALQLKSSVYKILSNNSSRFCLEDTLKFENSPPKDNNLLKKSSTISTFGNSNRNENFLATSVSHTSIPQNKTSDHFNITKENQKALKNFRSCLNKLTVDNFSVILEEVKMMHIKDEETILSFIQLLYKKAIVEPTYANHYVQLTIALKHIFKIGHGKRNFEYFAIMACQTGFEEAKNKLGKIAMMSDDEKDKLRHGLSGSIQFIAKMFLNRILTRGIIMEVCEALLKIECIESVEPLCKLLEICGSEIEVDKKSNQKVNKIMKKLSNLANVLPPRIKFMIQNLIEQRQNGWKSRSSKDAPKKLDQVASECGFVKRLGAVGRYDEVAKEKNCSTLQKNNYRGDHRGSEKRNELCRNQNRSFRVPTRHRNPV